MYFKWKENYKTSEKKKHIAIETNEKVETLYTNRTSFEMLTESPMETKMIKAFYQFAIVVTMSQIISIMFCIEIQTTYIRTHTHTHALHPHSAEGK